MRSSKDAKIEEESMSQSRSPSLSPIVSTTPESPTGSQGDKFSFQRIQSEDRRKVKFKVDESRLRRVTNDTPVVRHRYRGDRNRMNSTNNIPPVQSRDRSPHRGRIKERSLSPDRKSVTQSSIPAFTTSNR
jgi:hypothetical protein